MTSLPRLPYVSIAKVRNNMILMIPVLSLILLLPAMASFAQTVNEINTDPEVENPHIISPDDYIGPVGRADDLHAAHSDLTDIMRQQELGDFSMPDYPFVMTFVDEEKGDLVVVMHAMAAVANIEYEEEEIAVAIGHDVPIHIIYGVVVPEVPQSRIESWKQYYIDNCSPVKPGYQTVCTLFGQYLRDNGVDPDSLVPKPTVPVRPTVSASTSPCDEDEDSLACYYYKRYQERCIPTKTTSRCDTYATQIKNLGYEVPTSAADDTDRPVKVAPPTVTNVMATIANDSIRVAWDIPQYAVEKYRVITYENNRYADREYVTTNTYTYDDAKSGKEYKFRVYVYYEKSDLLTGTNGGYEWSNTVGSKTADNTAPVITVPDAINVTTVSNATSVTYAASALDSVDGDIPVSCTPRSGSIFSAGNTTVSCTAADNSGNRASATFVVSVTKVDSAQCESQGTEENLSCIVPLQTLGLLRGGEFYGGNQYGMIIANTTDEYVRPGTLTIGATNSSGTPGIVVAGHSLKFEFGYRFVEHAIGAALTPITSEAVPVFYGNGSNTDVAFIPITEPNIIVGNNIQALNGTIIRDVQFGNLSDVAGIYPKISIYGMLNNGEGFLLYRNSTVSTPNDGLLTNMGVGGGYPSQSGDSGAPIVYHSNGTSTLVGVHHGSVCALEDWQNGAHAALNFSSHTGICPPNSSAYYKVFTAWENARAVLNLQ